jgi:GntR family transcriptional regulator / MocR family aminotransferase
MSLARRLRLLDWATRAGGWVIEDDYDGEFRHGSQPLPTLQALDRAGRVLYVGTFSKILFPSLRLGYIIVPEHLVDAFEHAQEVAGHVAPTIDQAVLADFINDGHFTRHVRAMRRRYFELRRLLVDELELRVGNALTITGADVGLHVVARLLSGVDDREVSGRASAVNVTAPPLAAYYLGKPRVSGLVLGYGHLNDDEIRTGVRRLASALR